MTNKPPSPAEILLLGILYQKPLHGYELNKFIEDRGVRQWANIGFSSIYYLLEKLETKGLVETEGAEAKARKIFSITSEGKKVCKAQTKLLLAQRVPNKNPLMTGLANSFVLSESAMKKQLTDRKEGLAEQLKTLETKFKQQQPLPKTAQMLFTYSISQIESEMAWIKTELGT